MSRATLAALLPLLWAAQAAAQPMDPNMPGMKMPGMHAPPPQGAQTSGPAAHAKPAAKTRRTSGRHARHHGASRKAARPSGATQTAAPGMAGMSMAGHAGMAGMKGAASGAPDKHSMPGMDMSGHAAMPGMSTAPKSDAMPGMNMSGDKAATPAAPEPPIPQTPAPPPATDHAADRYYDPGAMAASRHMMRMEMGGTQFSKVMSNLLEYQTGSKGDGYRWDGQAWFGGDINRLVLKSEGEGSVRDGLEAAEAQALYSRAVGLYTDLQVGVRQDFSPHARTYLAAGAQTLFPYWFDAEGSLFLSTKGEVLARAEGYQDFRLAQRWVLQPRVELNFSAQNIPEERLGTGLTNAELGLRLRYEIRHEFAPYIGVSYDRRFGKTADYFRAAGDSPEATTFVVGLRAWF